MEFNYKLIKEKNKQYYFLSTKIMLGNHHQHIYIKGSNLNNPLLLFLHGGPGMSEYAAFDYYLKTLYSHFTIIHWDQLGCGKSYSKDLDEKSLSMEQMLSDTYQLITILLNQFNQEKIYLMGHSWGTVLGLIITERYPHLIKTYIGTAQIINRDIEERRAYQFILSHNKKKLKTKLIEPINGVYEDDNQISIQRRLLQRLGGFAYNKKVANQFMIKTVFNKEFTLKEKLNFFKAFTLTYKALWNDFSKCNFLEQINDLEVPIYLFMGKHDYVTYYALTEQFLNKLTITDKKLYIFENSGHLSLYEESNRFIELIINDILKK